MPLSVLHEKLNGLWKAVLLLVAIFSAGLTAGAVAGGLTKIPDRVTALETQATKFNGQLEDLNSNVMAIRKAAQQTNCLTIAERQHTDWRKCIE